MAMQIGALAKSTGLSVRTLHHYDEIDLLKPSQRTESGYRLYSDRDVERLQKILSLRQLGLSLNEISKTLEDNEPSLQEILDRQIERIEFEIENQKTVLHRLKSTNEYISVHEAASLETLLATIHELSTFERYFSKEQFQQLEEREVEFGPEKIRDAHKQWESLIHQVRSEMQKGTAPESPEVQELTQKWIELRDLFSDGDPKMIEAAQKMYKENPEIAEKRGIDQAVFDYVQASADSMK